MEIDESVISHVEEFTASEMIKLSLESYARYISESKYPNYIDGLKQVHRRIIYSIGSNTEKTKMAKYLASTALLHPHGDAPIKEAMDRLCQPFAVGLPLLKHYGNKGSYSNPKGASYRYADISISEISKDLFFSGVEPKTFKMVPNYDRTILEPEYFIPRLPTALFLNSFTIGFGGSSLTNSMNFQNVCELVQRYAEHKNKSPLVPFNMKSLSHLLIPDFPIANEFRNHDLLLNAYSNGNYGYPPIIDGTLKISKNKLIISNLPFGVAYNKTKSKLIGLVSNRKFWLNDILNNLDDFTDSSDKDESGGLTLTFKNNVDIFKYLDAIKRMIQFTSSRNVKSNYVKDNRILTLYTPELLRLWYEKRANSIVSGIKFEQTKLYKEKIMLRAQLLIHPMIDDVIKLTREHTGNENDLISKLVDKCAKVELSRYQAKIIIDMRLQTLSKTSKSDLEQKLDNVEIKLKSEADKFSTVDEIIYNDASYFKKKYKQPRKTVVPNYAGYVQVTPEGIIQYTDESELLEILDNFTDNSVRVYQYLDKREQKFLVKDDKIIYSNLSIPRQTTGSKIISSSRKEKYTLVIQHELGTAFCIEGSYFTRDNVRMIPISKEFYGIYKNGVIKLTNINENSFRKSVGSSGAKSDLIYGIPNNKSDMVMFYMNTEQMNVLRAERILVDKNNIRKISIPTVGHTEILAVIPYNTPEYILNIPVVCTKRLNMDFLKIVNIENILLDNHSNLIDLNKTKNDGVKISKHPDCKRMFVI